MKSEADLEEFVRSCLLTREVTSLQALQRELERSSWVIWPAETSSFQGVQPSAPLPEPSAPAPESAPSEENGPPQHQLLPGEVWLHGLFSGTPASLGPVLVGPLPPQGATSASRLGQPHAVLIRNPTDPDRALNLLQLPNRPAAMFAADALRPQLESRFSDEVYRGLCADPERQALLAQLAQEAAGPPASATPAEPAVSSASSSAPHGDEATECPICFEGLRAADAAMRCVGEGGQHHYFHQACIGRWIEQCRSGRGAATCPICRGALQFHAQRLQDFLYSEGASSLPAEDRSFLQQCVDRLKGAGQTWGDALTVENAKWAGGLMACAGWGFTLGYTQPPPLLQDQLVMRSLQSDQLIAQGVGYMVGVIVRLVREARRNAQQRQESDERTRHSRRC